MKRKLTSILITTCMILMSVANIRAGGAFQTYDITNATPSPIAGQLLVRAIPVRWDTRSIPVQFRVNNTMDPIPNPLGASFLSIANATTALQVALDHWNSVPTSFINMQIVGTTANEGSIGFDMVNEVNFRTPAWFDIIAESVPVTLIADSTLAAGEDIDGDGDSDVSTGITIAQDVDNDGDIEFPAGFYKAGTILDNDIQFNTKNSNGYRFTVDPAQVDTNESSIDLEAIATHEFGHALGLSHVPNNQTSANDGTGATMFPFVDTGDPAEELSWRSPEIDDIAYASYFYPEGSAASGPAALQPGDVPFSSAFGFITGELRHGILNQPIAGGYVQAIDRDTGEETVGAYSGAANLSLDPATGDLFLLSDASKAIVNGNYVIPVPRGNYNVRAEAIDGSPILAAQVNPTVQAGRFLGQQNFLEEFWNNTKESAVEREPGEAKNTHVNNGQVSSGVNIVTNRVFNINPYGARTSVGFINPPTAGYVYAVAFPAAEIRALNGGTPTIIQAGLFDTTVADNSVPVVFGNAWLATGVINPDNTATIDLVHPLRTSTPFLGQDLDLAPFYFSEPKELSETIRAGIANGTIKNLFLVLQIPPPPFPGVSHHPPLIGLSKQAPILGRSYLSLDGGLTFSRRNDYNFRFSLIASRPE